ncbi:MAG: hypothetical protein ABFD16_16025 [Thermoguttaceae bacterium]
MKKRIRRSDPQRQRDWEEVMRRWRESGKAVRAFCRDEGVRESAFYFWRRELARRDGQGVGNAIRAQASLATPSARSPQQRSRWDGPTPSFLPVRVVEPRRTEGPGGVEIVLEQGRTVRVPVGFDRQTLADVLAVLEVRPC